MQTLKAEKLTKTYGEKTLFNKINFIINEQDRIGLIGMNGTGKTNLLNAIANVDPADSGEIIVPNDYSISYLRQTPDFNTDMTVRNAIYNGDQPVFAAINNYENAVNAYAANSLSDDVIKRFNNAEAEMNRLDAWNTESDIKTILTQLHIGNLDSPIDSLSGGQVKRVALAQALLEKSDLLILDEPTNHLDFDSITWLETYLKNYPGAILLVTHDRYFLDRVTNHIWELSFGDLIEYQGNYQKYLEQKAIRDEQLSSSQTKAKKLYKSELEWMKRGPQGRGTKQQARINRFNELSDNVNASIQNQDNVEIDFAQRRLGKKVINIKNASLTIDNKTILSDFSELIQAGERIGITGENGAGKSSFLNSIAGKLSLDKGTIELGETVHLGYYTQQTEPIPGNERIISYLSKVGQEVVNSEGERISVASLLERFLFPSNMHGSLIRKLSGGEKRRLYLIKILMEQPNVLLLDEPTNDLDIPTLTVLEDYLAKFNGTVLTVSHDRYFLDKTSDRLLIFEGNGRILNYQKSISDYLAKQSDLSQSHVSEKKENSKVKTLVKKRTYMEQKEWELIEGDIAKLEKTQSRIENQMGETGVDYGKLSELQNELNEINLELSEKMDRWEYLADFEQ
ncbi:ABC-F family ATP-binding cassette domain-containing protein [Pediococcus claussenii]|uniref:Heme ABC exporter, ATP-binding protein CcmA n=1 Tax=Pediococcus claussenii (strain ATCC BAA-344 / DSM 14800 / JCM 18046 / KCTC 3811 / LMG 21948 / P06) TaxID=701521 RepID=G8PD48_PEDCP|nr:ABC-F family ATP-binding cassette domain-containing protein [Pediococcus claussenii]AEV95183.1 heme ABC exporter, ATP-binding protein CcmA [Pediococcus claussenii ATCC BAA-344]ANZ70415.1 multidrug ABC transporter ATP-binding protein [Pediococcus claussenii]ANZ72231.1 multidrug ABC transporter ATP-binding protein [Pediococcus claussenii]KRN19634.1 ccmA protein [Pediococcus claussenii]